MCDAAEPVTSLLIISLERESAVPQVTAESPISLPRERSSWYAGKVSGLSYGSELQMASGNAVKKIKSESFLRR